jgi:SPP1 family predicted phage head-tail adaptor
LSPSPNTSPSDLNKRVTLQKPERTPDGRGGFTVTWSDAATVWAAVWPVGANEIIQSDKQTMTVSHRIRTRYRSTVKASWRVSYAGRYFNIVSVVDPDTAHRWIDILCREAA